MNIELDDIEYLLPLISIEGLSELPIFMDFDSLPIID